MEMGGIFFNNLELYAYTPPPPTPHPTPPTPPPTIRFGRVLSLYVGIFICKFICMLER